MTVTLTLWQLLGLAALTDLVGFLCCAVFLGRRPEPGPRQDPSPRGQRALPRAGQFPADTGPLLIVSEQMAAVAAHERETQRMIAAAEELIPPCCR